MFTYMIVMLKKFAFFLKRLWFLRFEKRVSVHKGYGLQRSFL